MLSCTVCCTMMSTYHSGDEELAAIGVGSRIGHGQHVGLVVAQLEVLVGERVAIDGLSSGTIASSEVPAWCSTTDTYMMYNQYGAMNNTHTQGVMLL